MIDTHCHLNFEAFKDDWREVADRAVEAGVTKMIVVGADLESSKRAVELAQQHQALYASVGIHPHHAKQVINDKLPIKDLIDELGILVQKPRVVAIGEIGLDYHVFKQSKYPEDLLEITPENKAVQRELFIEQIKIAQTLNKPLILHSREAKEEVLEIIQEFIPCKGVFHCFGGSKKYAKRILDQGLYLGFDGDITYVPDRLLVANTIPMDRLLLETDSPLITPVPYRGERNEPKNVNLIAQAQAKARGTGIEEIDRVTSKNAQKLFNW